MEVAITGAEEIRWDLTDLHDSPADLLSKLPEVEERAREYGDMYRTRIGELSANELSGALAEAEGIYDQLGRSYAYAYLAWVTDTENPEKGGLLQKVRETYATVTQLMVFFDIEWSSLESSIAENLMAKSELDSFRHYLELIRLQKVHLLSEKEEIILSEKDVTGRSAWNRFFDETMSSLKFDLRGKSVSQQEVLSHLHGTDRELRRDAALAFTAGLESQLRPLTFVFNTILADKASTDRLRNYSSWVASRNISNEVSDEAVQRLIDSVTSRYDIVERFYRLKKKILGLDSFNDYDRYAPIGESDRRIPFDEARELVTSSYSEFNQEFGSIVGMFFDRNWIDAAVVDGKRSGAFSHGVVPSAHPYILMNYTGRIRDVQTLAHELGHGIHQYLSRSQGLFHSDTPLTTAETASVFGEMLVFKKLLGMESNPENQLAMLMGKIDDTIATVFRQVAMNRFEDRIHSHRRDVGELSSDTFSELWLDTQKDMFRGSVKLGDHYQYWWSYIPHFLHTPGYVYAYAFGELLVLALYAKYQEEGAPFAKRYHQLLASGGSDWPHVLVGRLGVDLDDAEFWNNGLSAIDDLVSEAESLATRVSL
ncbi:MAG: M3 family oligoendopeptidase [Rhodothermales bacterium]|nr:M3 family oligoendopeptidase [Rhodothermales bacterium]